MVSIYSQYLQWSTVLYGTHLETVQLRRLVPDCTDTLTTESGAHRYIDTYTELLTYFNDYNRSPYSYSTEYRVQSTEYRVAVATLMILSSCIRQDSDTKRFKYANCVD